MQAQDCQGRGGDVGIWVRATIADTPQLLQYFQPSAFSDQAPTADQPLYQSILTGYRWVDTQIENTIPTGDCAADVAQWATPAPAMVPFTFAWGETTGQHQTPYFCTDQPSSAAQVVDDNRYVGAERLPCDGFYVSCARAAGAAASRCAAWDAVSDRYVLLVDRIRQSAINAHPALGTAAVSTRPNWIGLSVVIGALIVAIAVVAVLRRVVLGRATDRGRGQRLDGGGADVPRL
jgi:hypothetical protein